MWATYAALDPLGAVFVPHLEHLLQRNHLKEASR